MPSTSNKSQLSPAYYTDGRTYVHNQHGAPASGFTSHSQRCYGCNKNTTSLGGRRHPILGLLCKFCVGKAK